MTKDELISIVETIALGAIMTYPAGMFPDGYAHSMAERAVDAHVSQHADIMEFMTLDLMTMTLNPMLGNAPSTSRMQ